MAKRRDPGHINKDRGMRMTSDIEKKFDQWNRLNNASRAKSIQLSSASVVQSIVKKRNDNENIDNDNAQYNEMGGDAEDFVSTSSGVDYENEEDNNEEDDDKSDDVYFIDNSSGDDDGDEEAIENFNDKEIDDDIFNNIGQLTGVVDSEDDEEDIDYCGSRTDFLNRTVIADSFCDFVKKDAAAALNNNINLNLYEEELIHPSSKYTRSALANAIFQLRSALNVSKPACDAFMGLLTDALPDVDFPVRTTKSGSVVFDHIVQKPPGVLEIDVCRRGCMAFINNYAKLIRCTHCGCHRFHLCTYKGCRDTECSPFGEGRFGVHRSRIPKRTIYYQSPIVQLYDLLKLSICVGNDNAPATNGAGVVYDFGPTSADKGGAASNSSNKSPPVQPVQDINQSKFGKKHKAAMNLIYERHVKETKDVNCLQRSFLLSIFVDGGKLFKRKSRSVEPLVLTVLNTDPYTRVRPGEGMFLTAFHDLAVGCNAEKIIFKDLLVPELNLLMKGIPLSFNLADGTRTNVLMQSRLISHCYDTPAGLAMWQIQGTNSKMSCRKCNNIHGVSRKKCVDTIANIGHRGMLGNNHWSRYCGISQLCCPVGYYRGTPEEMEKAADDVNALFLNHFRVDKNETEHQKKERLAKRKEAIDNRRSAKYSDPICKNRTEGCDGFQLPDGIKDKIDYTMHNNKYKPEDFLAFINFAHCDFSECTPHCLNDNAFFRTHGRLYDNYKRIIHKKLSETNEKNNSNSKIYAKAALTVSAKSKTNSTEGARKSQRVVDASYELLVNPQQHSSTNSSTKYLNPADLQAKVECTIKKNEIVNAECKGVLGRGPYDMLDYRYDNTDEPIGIAAFYQYDPFHALKNLVHHMIEILKGQVGITWKSNKLNACEGRFPGMSVGISTTEKQPKGTKDNEWGINSDNDVDNEEDADEEDDDDDEDSENDMADNKKKKKKKVQPALTRQQQKKNQYTNISNERCIPWILSNSDQHKLDWRHNSILIPSGNSSFKFEFPMKHTSYLKGHDEIMWLATFSTFDLAATQLTDEYKMLIKLWSELYADILSPVMSDEFVAKLLLRVIEGVVLIEGMLPDTVQYFATHQIVDIIDGLDKLGPVRGWWCLPGERVMAMLKRTCPSGGRNYLKTMWARFMAYQSSFVCRSSANMSEIKKNNSGTFTYNTTKLINAVDKINKNYWYCPNKDDVFVLDGLYNCLDAYINTLEVNYLIFKSTFWRVRRTFQLHPRGFRSFFRWILHIVNDLLPNGRVETIMTMFHFIKSEDDRMQIKNILSFEPTTDNPKILLKMWRIDVWTVKQLAKYLPKITKKAIVKGVELRARGPEYSEVTAPKDRLNWMADKGNQLILPTNPNNNLQTVWDGVDQFSAWYRFIQYDVTSKERVKPSEWYCQGNYFLEFQLHIDPYVHNVALANVTTRFTKISEDGFPYVQAKVSTAADVELATKNRKSFRIEKNYYEKIQFVALEYIVPTAVAVCGFTACGADANSASKPILCKTDGFTTEEINQSAKYCSNVPSDIDRLYFIDLINLGGEQDSVETCLSDLNAMTL